MYELSEHLTHFHVKAIVMSHYQLLCHFVACLNIFRNFSSPYFYNYIF